jgi:hypothetical protein
MTALYISDPHHMRCAPSALYRCRRWRRHAKLRDVKVVLLQAVPNMGDVGDVIEVRLLLFTCLHLSFLPVCFKLLSYLISSVLSATRDVKLSQSLLSNAAALSNVSGCVSVHECMSRHHHCIDRC